MEFINLATASFGMINAIETFTSVFVTYTCLSINLGVHTCITGYTCTCTHVQCTCSLFDCMVVTCLCVCVYWLSHIAGYTVSLFLFSFVVCVFS